MKGITRQQIISGLRTLGLPDGGAAIIHRSLIAFIEARGSILQLANGDLLASMYGVFKGDTRGRVVLSRSSDRGHTWRYYATVASMADPNPELPGQYAGPDDSSFALLPNGQMICVMRTQNAHLPAEYRPLYVCWSDDLGKTWTKPEATNPHLKNIRPTLAVLDNGVVACLYGRPGVHVAFSTDNGHTWRDRVSFSDLPEPRHSKTRTSAGTKAAAPTCVRRSGATKSSSGWTSSKILTGREHFNPRSW